MRNAKKCDFQWYNCGDPKSAREQQGNKRFYGVHSRRLGGGSPHGPVSSPLGVCIVGFALPGTAEDVGEGEAESPAEQRDDDRDDARASLLREDCRSGEEPPRSADCFPLDRQKKGRLLKRTQRNTWPPTAGGRAKAPNENEVHGLKTKASKQDKQNMKSRRSRRVTTRTFCAPLQRQREKQFKVSMSTENSQNETKAKRKKRG